MVGKRRVMWRSEAIERETFPATGSRVIQLTSAPVISDNIYCEQPYCTADGKRLVFLRKAGVNCAAGLRELWLCDLEKRRIILLESAICAEGMGCAAYGDWFYAVREIDNHREIVRYSLVTLEVQSVFDLRDAPPIRYDVCSVSSDYQYYVNMILHRNNRQEIILFNLVERTWKIIHEGTDIFNPHLQFSRPGAERILIQHNRGGLIDADGNIIRLLGEEGCTLYVIDRDGGNRRTIPVGPPHTATATGHECWVGETGEVAFTIACEGAKSLTDGSLLAAFPGDKKARVVARGFCFHHLSVSRDGKFFVCDASLAAGNPPIVVGSLSSGRTCILCESGTSTSTHAHPYFTGDGAWVIFNSNRTGVPQLCAASVPEGLLGSLE